MAEEKQARKLASAQELKGRKSAGGEKKPGGKSRRIALILTILLLAGAAVLIFVLSGQKSPETPAEVTAAPRSESVKLIDRKKSDVLEVTVVRDGERYTVCQAQEETADGKRYTLKDRPDFDLDQNLADQLITCAASLTSSRVVEENAQDLSPYGLDRPVSKVTMTYRDGETHTWLVGALAPTSTSSYFMEEDSGRVCLLYASAVNSLSRGRLALHVLSMPCAFDADRIRNVTLEREGKDTVEVGYSREGSADRQYSVSSMRLYQPFYYTANMERGYELLQNVAGLGIRSYAGETGEIPDCGLEEGRFRYRLTVRQENQEKEEDWVYRVGNLTEDGKSVYVMVDDTQAVYLTSADSLAFLEEVTPAYLVDQFANLIYIDAVEGLDIGAGEETWKIEIGRDSDGKASSFTFNGKAVRDGKSFRSLYQKIIGMTSSKISDDYFLDGEVLLSVHYRMTVEPGELQVDYIAVDGDYCAVRREGLTLFLIKREQVEALLEALRIFEKDLS